MSRPRSPRHVCLDATPAPPSSVAARAIGALLRMARTIVGFLNALEFAMWIVERDRAAGRASEGHWARDDKTPKADGGATGTIAARSVDSAEGMRRGAHPEASASPGSPHSDDDAADGELVASWPLEDLTHIVGGERSN